jgi:hypothetical protein
MAGSKARTPAACLKELPADRRREVARVRAVVLLSLYLMPAGAAALARLKAAFRKAGKKLDMGRSCIRFKRADDLPLDAIGAEMAAVPVDRFGAFVERARRRRN